jgi:hypothetical protein
MVPRKKRWAWMISRKTRKLREFMSAMTPRGNNEITRFVICRKGETLASVDLYNYYSSMYIIAGG